MVRYFFEIAYKGTAYHGWQKQQNAISIQEVVENVLSTIFKQELSITGSGRTDKGVHCEQQFFHIDIEDPFDIPQLLHHINAFLPPDIAIRSIRKVKKDAHARFDAIQREYEYRICRVKSPFLGEMSYYYFKPLDIEQMNSAAAKLLLYNDFESFSRVKTEVYTFMCNITKAEFALDNDLIIFYVSANRFLRGMVRAITGTLLDIGKGDSSVENFIEILESKDRRKAGRAVPSQGLFLTSVLYPKEIFID